MHKRKSPITSIITLLSAGAWSVVVYLWWSGQFWSESSLIILPIALALMSSLYLLFRDSDRLTALIGKILIVVGVMYVATHVLSAWTIYLSPTKLWAIGLIAYGLYLERISPHQRFYDWMFLAIASKVQFFLLTATTSQLTDKSDVLIAAWWGLLVLLILAVPLAARHRRSWFRRLVVATTLYSGLLFAYTSWQLSLPSAGLFLVALTALWPTIATRWVGRRVFMKNKKSRATRR